MDNELLLYDRLEVIRTTIQNNGEENFYISFSGGRDSTVLHYLIDMAIPGNKIPRVFCNTGIEYNDIVSFVKELAENDDRFQIITPKKNIKQMLEEKGYPFKSKDHSNKLAMWQRGGRRPYIYRYINGEDVTKFKCPNKLKYQFEETFTLKVSDRCCYELKKHPFKKWQKENGKNITITGMQKVEGGQRVKLQCIVTNNNEIVKFHPLAVVTDDWENWFIQKYDIKLCKLYYPPYNFRRTGCKGCPYALQLRRNLEVMQKYMPNERKQCEIIWKPVYDEYRRIGYRLKRIEEFKLFDE